MLKKSINFIKRNYSKYQPLRGFHDILPEEQKKRDFILKKCYEISSRYNFQHISTPIIENENVFKRTLGEDSDIVSKEMYIFQKSDENLCLRPEGTAGIVRSLISNSLYVNLPKKLAYDGPMFRYERPQKGRYRQFHQFGVESFGSDHPFTDVEIIEMGYQILTELGIQNINLELNSLGTLNDRLNYKIELRKFLEINKENLSKQSQERLLNGNIMRILDSKSKEDREIVQNAPKLIQFLSKESLSHFTTVQEGLELLKIPYKLSPYLVRGLDYYSHTCFEFKIDHENLGESKDTVLAGGRYDELVKLMGGPNIPAIGWACGLERLGLIVPNTLIEDKVISIIAIRSNDKDEISRNCLKVSSMLRDEGFKVQYFPSGNATKQFEKANQTQSIICLVFGEDEIKGNYVNMKEMFTGIQEKVQMSDLIVILRNKLL